MGKREADSHKEGIFRLIIQLIHCPASGLPILVVGIFEGINVPVHSPAAPRSLNAFFFRAKSRFGPADDIEFWRLARHPASAMINLANRVGGVARIGEVLGQGDEILPFFDCPKPGSQAVDSSGRRP